MPNPDKYINLTELGRFKTKFIGYLTDNYYTQTQVNNLLSTYKTGAYKKVNITTYPTLASFLASTGEEGFWYLYPKKTSESPTFQSGYYNYIWEDNAWVFLGDTNIDLSDYATKAWCNETFVKLTNSDYTDAISKKHSHSNKATLDAIEVAFTSAMNTKLNNAIQGIKVNGTAQTPDSNKVVDIDLSGYLEVGATAADSSKLNGQSASYYLNYNNLSNKPTIPTVSNATITIKQTGKSDQTFTLNGSATTITLNDTTYSAATTTAAGLMSASDKSKLDGIASGATVVTESTVSGWGFTKTSGTVTSVDSISPTSGNVALSAVRYVSQTLTEAQKTQARTNIGAGTSSLTIGTTASTAAAGNHNHDSDYVKYYEQNGTQMVSAASDVLTLYCKTTPTPGTEYGSCWLQFRDSGQDGDSSERRWRIGTQANDSHNFYIYKGYGQTGSVNWTKVIVIDHASEDVYIQQNLRVQVGGVYEQGVAISDKYVHQVSGKGLSTNDYTTADQTKVNNAIQGIKVNNTAQTPDANKVVNISVPDIVAATDADIDALFS